MYQAKDGKNFGNHEMGRHYDATRPAKEDGEGKDGDSEHSIEEHVEEHGPADHVEIHSHHGGQVHKSTHHDAESAHEHISKAFGEAEAGSSKEHGEPDGDEAEMSEGIPGFRG